MTDAAGTKRVAIVHYGEHAPLDSDYRPARMGQLAQWMVEAGLSVTRFVPTYSPFTGTQRPQDWSGTSTVEGTIEMIPTRSYTTSVSRDRFGFLVDFGSGVASRAASLDPFDLIIVGYPPPGIVSRLRRALGRDVPIVADIRDLWPDALVPSHRRALTFGARMLGRGLATELRWADGVVAMSEPMLRRAPKSVRMRAIHHSIPSSLSAASVTVEPTQGLQAVFVGSFTQGVDLEALFGGWQRFVSQQDSQRRPPRLRICGHGERAAEVEELAAGLPTVELLGWVPASTVRDQLSAADIGIAATRPGFGTTFSNKVIEYLGTGLFVLNSLEAEVGAELERFGLGLSVPSTAEGWSGGFIDVDQRLDEIRDQRIDRRTTAIQRNGRSAIEKQWWDVLEQIGFT